MVIRRFVCCLCVFITFSLLAFLPFLSCPVSISHTHPLRSRSPFHSLIHTFMQLECQWGPRSLSTQQCNSLTAVDLCQEEPQMPQQQFTCWWYYNNLNYRKQSRFVIVSWADFSHCKSIQYVYIKWHIMYIFTITKHSWWIFIFSYRTLLHLHSLRGSVCLTLRLSLETGHWRFLNAASAWLEFWSCTGHWKAQYVLMSR